MTNSIVYNKFIEFISSEASCIVRYNCVWETIPAENDTYQQHLDFELFHTHCILLMHRLQQEMFLVQRGNDRHECETIFSMAWAIQWYYFDAVLHARLYTFYTILQYL